MGSRTSPYGLKWQWYVQSNDLLLYSHDATLGTYMTVAKSSTGTAAEFGLNGTNAANRTLTINSVSSTGRPAIKIVNANATITSSSTGKTLAGWLPIDIDGTTYTMPFYTG
jgi:hypothetical protein